MLGAVVLIPDNTVSLGGVFRTGAEATYKLAIALPFPFSVKRPRPARSLRGIF